MSHTIEIIMPGVLATPKMAEISMQAVETCTKTAPDARILFLDNGGESTPRRTELAKRIEDLGHGYVFVAEAFNESKFYNLGAAITASSGAPFLMFANCDLIFHPEWLDELMAAWSENPGFYCLAPYSASEVHQGLCYRAPGAVRERRVVDCDHPSNWAMCFRRQDHPFWDERLRYWGADDDIHMQMKAVRRRCGVVYSSRVDHLADAVKNNAPANFGFELSAHQRESELYFKEKWGLV